MMLRRTGLWYLAAACTLLGVGACGGGGNGGGPPTDGSGGSPDDGSGGTSTETGGSSNGECAGCRIDEECVDANAEHPQDPCLLCLPEHSTSDWSTSNTCCDDEPVSFACNDDGDVVGFNGCDEPTGVVHACSQLEHRVCQEGACACAAGWTGDDCERVLLHVRPDGDDDNDGRTWDEAFATLGAALAYAAGVSPAEIWVATGTYTPPSNPESPREATLQLAPGVHLYGGFTGTETARSDRDFEGNVTVLSGDIGTEDDTSDNVHHVVTGADDTTLDGFTVTGGNADGDTSDTQVGAGMRNVDATVLVANCVFTQNSAGDDGGGMHNSGSNVTVLASHFMQNSAGGDGGGMFNADAASVTVVNSRFAHNTATALGGGIASSGATLVVVNTVLARNSADSGAGLRQQGGDLTVVTSVVAQNTGEGLRTSATNSDPAIINSVLWGNTGDPVVVGGGWDADVVHSIVQGGCPEQAECTAVIDADPLFVDPDSDDFRLKPGSPAIDTGSDDGLPADTLDLDGDGDTTEALPVDFVGRPRVVGPRVDIGIHEASCEDTPGVVSGIGPGCAPVSCLALLDDQPDSPDGDYWLAPDGGTPYRARCDMTNGGWTLLFQQDTDFDRAEPGDATSSCYAEVCASAAYDRLPLGNDLRFDASDDLMSGEDFVVRTTVNGIDANLVGKTLHAIYQNDQVRYYVEQDDNGNVQNQFAEGYACDDETLPFRDYESLICGERVITFNDPAGCNSVIHLVGGETSRELSWINCAGWPETLDFNDVHHFPAFLRIWTR